MNIFEYTDYRAFLRTWIASLPKKGRGEINRIAELLGVNATLVSQTLSGLRDFTEEQAFEISKHMGLPELEREYFELLIRISRAGTYSYKAHLEKQLRSLKKESKQLVKRMTHEGHLSEEQKAIFYSSYLNSAIRLYCSIGNGKTLTEIAERFLISRAKATSHLEFLISAALCLEEKGRFKMGPQSTHLESTSPHVIRHHSNWRQKAVQRAETLSSEELMFSGPLSISEEDFETLRERMLLVISEVSKKVRASNATEIACFNLDLFWIDR